MTDTPYLVFSDEQAHEYANVFELYNDYIALMSRLHGPADDAGPDVFLDLLQVPSELLAFIWKDKQLIATAQASLARLHRRQHVYVNDVVVHDDYERQGFGRILMSSLQFFAWERWGQCGMCMCFILTNSPRKDNAGFYEKLGFKARTEVNNDPSVIWVREIVGRP